MGFMEAYKRLERLCRDSLQDDRGVSAYIDEMLNTPRGATVVDTWNADLKQLKHYRHLRNQIAHDPAYTEDMCSAADEKWLKAFYKRIVEGKDPLTLYRKAGKAAKRQKPGKTVGKRIVLTLAALVLLIIIAVLWGMWENTALQLNTISITDEKLPPAFDGFRIAQVSDLHNSQMGQGNEKLLSMLEACQPDIIAITGDIVDSTNTDVAVALAFAEAAVKIAPCYYVTGNNEARIEDLEVLLKGLTRLGVTVLQDEMLLLEHDGQTIVLMGVGDPDFQDGTNRAVMDGKLQKLSTGGKAYTVLLSHRPELAELYEAYGIDLVLSGHAHGGQVRLPFVGGIFAPHQGLFPEYDAGLYTIGDTYMVVSRGIGNSAFPLRFNNPPEVVLITLHYAQ